MALTLLDTVALLFGLAAILGLLNHHLFRLPFTIGMTFSALLASLLVLAVDMVAPGLGIGATVRATISGIDFTYTLMHGMLAFLLFAGALHVDLEGLRKHAVPVLALATFGTLISTGLVGAGSYFLFDSLELGVPFAFCLVLGALIAPTDPVAVLGIMRAAGAPRALEVKVIGESLFNDGLGVVIFAVLVSVATGGADAHGHGAEAMNAASVLLLLGREVIGGVLLGLLAGYTGYRALRSIDEANLETLISVAMVMGINLIAFKLHTSSPLACVIAGLFIGNRGRYFAMSDDTREHLDIVWSFIDEALNAILFLLIGIELVAITFSGDLVLAGLALIPMVLFARFGAVALPLNALKALRVEFATGTTRVLTWGGLKGGISIALAMSLPEFEGREAVIASTYAVVVFSILLQGLTVGKLIERIVPAERLASEGEEAEPAAH